MQRLFKKNKTVLFSVIILAIAILSPGIFYKCFAIVPALSQQNNESRIFGQARDYANSNIVFYKYADRITFLKDTAFVVEFDSNGNFEIMVFVDDIRYVFAEYEVYHAYFYLEPGQEYELIFPPLEYKTGAQIFNPFFRPERVHIGINNMKKTDLNYLINEFDYFHDRYFDMHYIDIATKGIESNVDTFINEIKKHFSFAENEYFDAYTKYRYAALRHLATHKKFPHVVVYANYTKDTVRYDNPAYMDLFNLVYDRYFDVYLGTRGGRHLYNFVHFGHSISNIRQLFDRHLELDNEQFKELVILKGINDAFIENNFAWLPLLLTLDSLHVSTEFDIHRDIAQNIADNTLSMANGTIAPPFELEDTSGVYKSLAAYRGRFVYLVFANTASYTSQMELGLLKRIHDRYHSICNIVTVLTDENRESAKEFIRRNNFEWDFLFTSINSPVISTYKISAYPTYFFIDPSGTLIMSPAPGPAENFERYLFEILKHRDELH